MTRNVRRPLFLTSAPAHLAGILIAAIFGPSDSLGQASGSQGASVTYRLPASESLPKAYRVTLAITDPKDPDWIVSTFVAGATRVVTKENGGHFTEQWNGLDDNFMPLPPGRYGVKGIYMEASLWPVDGQYHSVVARYQGAADSWEPERTEDRKPLNVSGDPLYGYPLADIAVTPDGIGAICFYYLENAKNPYLLDLKRAIGYDQVVARFPSGGTAGGTAVTTDGQSVWAFTGDLPITTEFIYRADGKPFGKSNARYIKNVYRPAGWVTGLASWRDASANRSFVYVIERGAFETPARTVANQKIETESNRFPVNKFVVLDGQSAAELATGPIFRPRAIAVRFNRLFVLHEAEPGGFVVSSAGLHNGLPLGDWQRVLALPPGINPSGLAIDGHANIYVTDSAANKVYKFDASGRPPIAFGRLDAQVPGAYDRLSFIAPEKIASWTDPDGHDRLVVLEAGGPNRLSEWGDDGKLLREWMVPQTGSNHGYAPDPRHPNLIYMLGQRGWLDRFRVDYKTGKWETDAVWPGVGITLADRTEISGRYYPKVVYHGENPYLTSGYTYSIYRLQNGNWVPSAGLVSEVTHGRRQWFVWRDVNGNGKVEPEEYRGNPTAPPKGTLRYFGETWLDDLSLVAIGEGTADIWRLAPAGFDRYGNPIYDPNGWKRIITDPVFAAKRTGTADPLHGGNELGTAFNVPWAMAVGSMEEGFYVGARGGASLSSNFGSQEKITRYVRDGKGGFRAKWRVGRVALSGAAQPGEVYASIFLDPPINGIMGVTDNSRSGYVLYTSDGLYVDTLLGDGRAQNAQQLGMYFQPEEFIAGHDYLDTTGAIRLAFGKTQPILYDISGWNSVETPVHPLTELSRAVTIEASQIASPPEFALRLRNGPPIAVAGVKIRDVAVQAKIARIASAPPSGPALDGSMTGWQDAEPEMFTAGPSQTIEARCLYDSENLYVRWHVRLGRRFEPQDLNPPERMFIHDRHADTVSLYFQGDAKAASNGPLNGRPGDVRFIFGLFQMGGGLQPAVLGLYPRWYGPGKENSFAYHSPFGNVSFQNVSLVPARTKGVVDPDGMGFVIAAAIPREAIPNAPQLAAGVRTGIDFEATLGGVNKVWWANTDGSASKETSDEPSEAQFYPAAWGEVQLLPDGQRPH